MTYRELLILLVVAASGCTPATPDVPPTSSPSRITPEVGASATGDPAAAKEAETAWTMVLGDGADGVRLEMRADGTVYATTPDGRGRVGVLEGGIFKDGDGKPVAELAPDGRVIIVGEDEVLHVAEDGTVTTSDRTPVLTIEPDGRVRISEQGDGTVMRIEGGLEHRRTAAFVWLVAAVPQRQSPPPSGG